MSRNLSEKLAEYLRRKLQANPELKLRKIAERSGGGVTHSYLSKLLSGAASNPSLEIVEAMAQGLGVPVGEILAALDEEPESEAEEKARRATNYVRALPGEKQDDALLYLEMLYQQYSRRNEAQAAASKGKAVKGAAKGAARKRRAS